MQSDSIHYSPGWCRMLGYAPQEVAPRLSSWADRVYEDDWHAITSALQAHLEGDAPTYMVEHRIRHRDGRLLWVLNRGRVVERDDRGRPVRMIGTQVDVTARYVTESALRESQRFNSVLLDASLDCVTLLDLQGRLQHMNRPGLDKMQIGDFSTVRGVEWISFWPTELHERAQAALDAARVGGVGRLDGCYPTMSGELRWWEVTITPVRDMNDQPYRLLCISRDVTDSRDAQDRLRESETRFRRIAERAPMGIFISTAAGESVYANPRLCEMHGVDADALCGGEWRTMLHPEDADALLELRRTFLIGQQDNVQTEYRFIRPDGAVRRARLEYVRMRGPDGTTEGFAGITEDITERVALDNRIRQTQKLEAVGQLAGGIAHDFNNLLTVMNTYGAFLREEPGLSQGARADLEELLAAANRAGGLTRQLLAFSRRQMMQPRLVDANSIVLGLESMLRRVLGAQVNLVTDLHAAVGSVLADPGQMEQVLINLALNARDAMPDGGLLVIETEPVTLTCEEIRKFSTLSMAPTLDERPGAYVVIRVTDQGIGMNDETQRQMFVPFFTTKPAGKGTGLGLPTVYGIIAQSGGYLRVRSAPGEGSSFEVFLPRQEQSVLPETSVAETIFPANVAGSETILLVEDEQAVRHSVRRLLSRAGYSVIEARHGADGLLRWREHREQIALVLTDLVMPELGGAELARAIELDAPHVPIVLMSGYASEQIRASLRPDATIVEKPFDSRALLRTVRQALDESAVTPDGVDVV